MTPSTDPEGIDMTEPPADLATFLRARLEEDEKLTRDLLADAQRTSLTLQEPKLLGKYIPGWHDWPRVEKMCAAHVAEVEAKRKIIDLCVAEIENGTDGAVTAQSVLSLLTLPYVDHEARRP